LEATDAEAGLLEEDGDEFHVDALLTDALFTDAEAEFNSTDTLFTDAEAPPLPAVAAPRFETVRLDMTEPRERMSGHIPVQITSEYLIRSCGRFHSTFGSVVDQGINITDAR
jgi:hypothetical protein